MVVLKCLNCGQEYQVRNYRAETSHFCSKSCCSSYNYAKGLGKCTHEHLKGNKFRVGKKPTYSFPKGHKPWNKGLKGIHLSPNSEFKKGGKAINHQEIGTITTRLDNFGRKRNYIKIAEPNVWKNLYVYIWEKANGEIPKGYVIHHINKIPDDDRLENLICLTRAEHMKIHRDDIYKKTSKKGEQNQ